MDRLNPIQSDLTIDVSMERNVYGLAFSLP